MDYTFNSNIPSCQFISLRWHFATNLGQVTNEVKRCQIATSSGTVFSDINNDMPIFSMKKAHYFHLFVAHYLFRHLEYDVNKTYVKDDPVDTSLKGDRSISTAINIF